MLGTGSSEITAPSLAGPGNQLLSAGPDGTFQRTNIKTSTIPKLETAARNLGLAMETSGALAAAFSSVPEITLQADEPMRCGLGTGGFGSQYAMAAGCAVRVANKLHLNGALSYAPSIDYGYGATPSIAGRLGVSFPLGKARKPKTEEITALKQKLQELEQQLANNQANPLMKKTTAPADQGLADLVALLRERIQELEEEKKSTRSVMEAQERRIEKLERLVEQLVSAQPEKL